MDNHCLLPKRKEKCNPPVWTGCTEPPSWFYDEYREYERSVEESKKVEECRQKEVHLELMRTCVEYKKHYWSLRHFTWAFEKRRQAEEEIQRADQQQSYEDRGWNTPCYDDNGKITTPTGLREKAARMLKAADIAEKCAREGCAGDCGGDMCDALSLQEVRGEI